MRALPHTPFSISSNFNKLGNNCAAKSSELSRGKIDGKLSIAVTSKIGSEWTRSAGTDQDVDLS